MKTTDQILQDIVEKIADLCLSGDPHDQNIQWQEGYQQACRDIALYVARTAAKLHSEGK